MADYQKIGAVNGKGLGSTKPFSLKQTFGVRRGEVISLVGGGGKTTLMFALAQELAAAGESVITTTTTKILKPSSAETPLLLVETGEEKLLRLFLQNMDKYRHITLASEVLPPRKLNGVSPELVVKLAELNTVSCIIVEADGAARRPLKAPSPHEPVIPHNTSLVIPVVGIDALGCKLTEETVFRSEIVSRLTGLSMGRTVSAETIALLITHLHGITKGSPTDARIVPLVNKVDLSDGLARGRELASKILDKGHPQIERVVLGQVQLLEPVMEIISREVR